MQIPTWTLRLLVASVSLLAGLALAGAVLANAIPNPPSASPLRTVEFVPNGVEGQVYALAVNRSTIYLGGKFNGAGDAPAANVAKWDGSNWSALGNGLDGPVYALAWDDDNHVLYAGGSFSHMCPDANCSSAGVRVNHIAAWDGNAWSAIGNGVDGDVYALALDADHSLYAGGSFTSICAAAECTPAVQANNIARWNRDGKTWQALVTGVSQNGVNGVVRALAWQGAPSNLIYAGGDFATAGSVPVNRVAKWDPGARAWARLNFGLSGIVRALEWDSTSGQLYAGGDFASACGNTTCGSPTTLNYVAKWDGTAWSALGGGVNGPVFALAQDISHDLYAGGDFSGAGDLAANRIAKWSFFIVSGSWSALGSGSDSRVTALAVSGSSMYAAGRFTVAKDAPADGIGRWTPGTSKGAGNWSALASGTSGRPVAPNPGSPFGWGVLAIAGLVVLAAAVLVGARLFGPISLTTPRFAALAVLGLALLTGVGALATGVFSSRSPSPPVTPDLQARVTLPTTVPTPSPVASLPVPTAIPVRTDARAPTAATVASARVGNSPTPTLFVVTPTPPPGSSTPDPTMTSIPTITTTASATTPPEVALHYPAVPLHEPRNGQTVQGESATFEWQDLGLKQTDHYELLLRHLGSVAWDKSYKVAGGKFVLYLRDGFAYDDYVWTILILDAQQRVVSQAGEERKVTWQPKGAGQPSNSGAGPPVFVK